MNYLKAFVIGGLICVIGQLLIDKTKMTSARILVLMVVVGCILGGFGWYQNLVDFAGAGASVPLPGFGNLLARGVIKEIDTHGIIGILSGGLKAASAGISAAISSAFIMAQIFSPRAK
jgi:stage V sporulation protein AE